MFAKIAAGIQYPQWVTQESDDDDYRRYKRLDLRDRLLDGSFYNHLHHAFYDEQDQGGNIIKLVERRPSVQLRLHRMVVRWCSRKLFAGRHIPKLRHADAGKVKRINALLKKAKFWETMKEAVILGSVGSVAATFRIDEQGDLAVTVWRAKYCKPSFDPMGQLAQLRVCYTTTGAAFIADGYPEGAACLPRAIYWFIRDYTPAGEVTYQPVKKDDWNPVHGFTGEGAERKQLEPWPERVFPHQLRFVTGHWFKNLPGGIGDDGACTFEDAIPNIIELDYTASQIGRGVRYNCSPTLMTKGLKSGTPTAGAINHLEVEEGHKQEDGETIGAGDAKLLEMSGTGTAAAMEMTDKVRKYTLEQMAASRKDPDKMRAPLSGRAMEYLDQDSDDLVHDLRSQYGDCGALPLIKKIAVAAGIMDDNVGALSLQWPRLTQLTPDEIFALVQALTLAIDPMKKSQPGTPGKKPASAAGSYEPATPPTTPQEEEQLLTVQEARLLLRQILDLTMLDEEGDEADDDAEDSPTPPQEPTPTVPPPIAIDIVPAEPGSGDEPHPGEDAVDGPGGMTTGGRVFVDA